jgi:CheY-like chemotaxis protein
MPPGLSIVVAGDDLLFSAQIAAALTRLGHRPTRVRDAGAFREALRKRPDAAVLNLASFRLDALAAIREAKADPGTRAIPLLGFCGHADTPRQAAARAAGCDLVASNAEVTGNLGRLLNTALAIPRSSPHSR